ncbi:hypothetical protein AB0D11_44720 [Streptomyces monashensis]|uniref:hypothetical protein n=1 Tax=Streptomyces monashensis TaxID=1678012 RepID=UPI0033EE5158
MGEHDQDQAALAEPARSPPANAQAREVTDGLWEAVADVRLSLAVPAATVRDAHVARIGF